MDAFIGAEEKSFNRWFDKFAISKCEAEGEKIWRKIIVSFLVDLDKRVGDWEKRGKNSKKRKIKFGKRKSFKGKRIDNYRKRKLVESKRERA